MLWLDSTLLSRIFQLSAWKKNGHNLIVRKSFPNYRIYHYIAHNNFTLSLPYNLNDQTLIPTLLLITRSWAYALQCEPHLDSTSCSNKSSCTIIFTIQSHDIQVAQSPTFQQFISSSLIDHILLGHWSQVGRLSCQFNST